MSTIRREDERSFQLRPFARRQTLNIDAHGNTPFVSYTYPADYGEEMNSVGLIGDRSMAGKREVQYGTVPDHNMPLYRLTDSDIQTLMLWMPDGWNLPKIRGILLVEFHRTATDLPALTWPDITAVLNTRGPGPAAATPDPVSVAAIDDDAHLPPAKLAAIFKVSKQRLQSSLNRWRPTVSDGCWIEVPNRKPREPQYLYRVGSIRPILDKLKSNSERTAK